MSAQPSRVLVVHDESAIRDTLGDALELEGYEFRSVGEYLIERCEPGVITKLVDFDHVTELVRQLGVYRVCRTSSRAPERSAGRR